MAHGRRFMIASMSVCDWRQASPSETIIDSQRVKTASKGGIAVMTLVRK
jgi:hypothetical protein